MTSNFNCKAICAGLIIVALGGAAVWWFVGRDRSPSGPQDFPKTPLPTVETAPSASTTVTNAPTPKPVAKPPHVRNEKAIKLREKLKDASPEEQRRLRVEYMAERPMDLTSTTNHPFRSGIERSMAQIFMTRLGNMPPPPFTTKLPIRDEAHLMEILESENKACEGDSEQIAEAKELVMLAKKELREYLKDGGKVEDFLEYYHGKLREAFEERRVSAQEVSKVAREDPSLAREFLEQVNAKLEAKGIKPVDFNAGAKRILEEKGY